MKRRRDKSRKNKIAALAIIAVVLVSIVVVYSVTSNNDPYAGKNKVLLQTTMGNITIELYNDMPITVGNFRKLVSRGTYNNTIFHRVIDGFVVQGGDPTGTGYGNSSIPSIPDEFTDHNRNDKYTVAMANTGEPNTGSSQFFINLVNNNGLDDIHPVFGRVIEGTDVVEAIGKVETSGSPNYLPISEVKIIKAELIG